MSDTPDERESRKAQLKEIRDEVLALTSSPLYEERVKNGVFPVIGEGDHMAAIMFVGEAPGQNEAKTGRPFCGASGRILDELLASIKVARESVYITNIVKDRPPGNRDPQPEEIEIYAPFLDRQIHIIRPKVIATLGRFSMAHIIKKYGLDAHLTTISKMHGQLFEASAPHGTINILPLYHPATALYGGNTAKAILLEDFKVLKDLV